jgi:hypothetical protein
MRIPARCSQCDGRALTYATVQSDRFTIRYKRCDQCGTTSKTISLKPVLSSNKSIDAASDDTDTLGVINHRRSHDDIDSKRTTHSARGDFAGRKDSATASGEETEVI